jgi:hypothetical protein
MVSFTPWPLHHQGKSPTTHYIIIGWVAPPLFKTCHISQQITEEEEEEEEEEARHKRFIYMHRSKGQRDEKLIHKHPYILLCVVIYTFNKINKCSLT